ncbi:Aspartate aminotransferase [uncultured archaeon]|nr:Aspartate aminotransferase [uncultured archaeon]
MLMKAIDLKLGEIKDQLPARIIQKFSKNAFANCNRYPSNYFALLSKLAGKLGVDKEEIVLTNGVDEGIELIARCFGEKVLVFGPSYFELLDAPKRNGIKCRVIDCFNGKGYSLKYSNEDLEGVSLIYLCNPNNPFGLLTKKQIVELASKTKAIIAIDETYIDFDGESAIKSAPNILVLRSFSKGYSMAGFRVGFVVGEKNLIDTIKTKKLFFNVSSVSVEAALIALDEEKYFGKLITEIKKRKDSFERFLSEKGFNVIHTNTNNIIIKFSNEIEATKFNNFLKSNSILANQGDGISTVGLDNSWIRFSCGTKEQMAEAKKRIEKW